jgi:hypothetical protein
MALWYGNEACGHLAEVEVPKSTPCGTRTRNLRIRSPTPCPLGQGGCCVQFTLQNQVLPIHGQSESNLSLVAPGSPCSNAIAQVPGTLPRAQLRGSSPRIMGHAHSAAKPLLKKRQPAVGTIGVIALRRIIASLLGLVAPLASLASAASLGRSQTVCLEVATSHLALLASLTSLAPVASLCRNSCVVALRPLRRIPSCRSSRGPGS